MDGPNIDSTLDLLQRARAGDAEARDRLFARWLPGLSRWASGRLPRSRYGLLKPDDFVQETLVSTFKGLNGFDHCHEGGLMAFLRQAVMNRIRDETPGRGRERDRHACPLELAIGREAVERYEAALQRLRAEEREAIVARIEMDCTYDEVARALGQSSADAARIAVGRALLRLAEEMNRATT